MTLYSKNGSWPEMLPHRITLSTGFTRTDPSTFTAEEIADAGYVAVDYPPNPEYPNEVMWDGIGWQVIPPTSGRTAAKKAEIQNICKLKLSLTDYKVIKAVELGEALNPDLTNYRQQLRDIYNSVDTIDIWNLIIPDFIS
jgi:hypothetical protein